ncbi:MAG: TatD family hydrolase [Verrucomicrobiota bacterium]|nr:TatD family hydrolase [Limisphaera sp.]MDW8381551.1 TatD family hydrolase [Verrucomicrobiota bacterium]
MNRMPRLYDAHNHLQDERFGGQQATLVEQCRLIGVQAMVVNGACEDDWPEVLALARAYPEVVPSFGYHPWYVHQRSSEWLTRLRDYLELVPSAVGEIGLDRWKSDLPYEGQEEVFLAQWRLAAERNLPVSIHCLRAWGRLFELIRSHPGPTCGFLLHSYGGPAEMVQPLAALGAYFSMPGYFAHSRKEPQRKTFLQVPLERLLLETDAPDQLLPPELVQYPITDPASGRPINHPANLAAIYAFAAELRGLTIEELAAHIEANFYRLFGRIRPGKSGPAMHCTTNEAAANPKAPVT